jgi:hypothetical protein
MSFDFDKGLESAAEDKISTRIGAIVLGQSGGGKSFLTGTLGVKTLYLYLSGEDHGVDSARITGGDNIVGYPIDIFKKEALKPDEAYAHLLATLSNIDGLKKHGFRAIVLDGATEVEALIRSTVAWEKATTSKSGKHDGFAESGVTQAMFRPIIAKLKNLRRELDMHYLMTCILDVKQLGENGEIQDSQPRLTGYSVAESLVQQFGDVLVVGRMAKDDIVKHKIQMMAKVIKVSKTESGVIKKAGNYNPRIQGVSVEALPNILPADLKEIVKIKEGKRNED